MFMKIAVLSHMHFPIAEPFAGGLEMHTHMMVNELVERGHDVTLYGKAASETKAKLFVVVGKNFTFKSYKRKLFIEMQEWFMHCAEFLSILHMRTQKYDIIINNSLSPLPYYWWMRDMPMVTILHTPATLERVNKIIEKKSWKPSPFHKYISVSESNSIGWRKLLGEVIVVPNGIRLEDWKTTKTPCEGQAVWSGRITPEKGLHIALKAAKLAKMNLKIAGPKYDKKYFETQIKPELDETTEYVGHIDHENLAIFYASGQVSLSSPVWEEPFGLTAVEALAVGTPVAALPHGAMNEIISLDVGAVSRDDSPEAFAEAIIQASKMNRSTCKAYAQKFSVTAMVEGYEQVISGIRMTSMSGHKK